MTHVSAVDLSGYRFVGSEAQGWHREAPGVGLNLLNLLLY